MIAFSPDFRGRRRVVMAVLTVLAVMAVLAMLAMMAVLAVLAGLAVLAMLAARAAPSLSRLRSKPRTPGRGGFPPFAPLRLGNRQPLGRLLQVLRGSPRLARSRTVFDHP